MEKPVHKQNYEQWSGHADTYHRSRPTPPEAIVKMVLSWLKKSPDMVVDVGCGTGLSTTIWSNHAQKIIGIEPNDDMRKTAEATSPSDKITYQNGLSNEINLPDNSVDIITVSQAFHWMDIESTLTEFHRILKPDGILAIYDCNFPPITDWKIEKAYDALVEKSRKIIYTGKNPPVHNDKSTYCERIKSSGKFRYVKETVCHSMEKCDRQRLMDFTMLQGNVGEAIKISPELNSEFEEFVTLVDDRCAGEFDIFLPYKIVIAAK